MPPTTSPVPEKEWAPAGLASRDQALMLVSRVRPTCSARIAVMKALNGNGKWSVFFNPPPDLPDDTGSCSLTKSPSTSVMSCTK